MKIIKKLIFCVIIGSSSCDQIDQNDFQFEIDSRVEFLKDKPKSQVVSEYLELTLPEKKELWLAKLNHTLLGNLSQKQRFLMQNLITELQSVATPADFYKEEIRLLALELAREMDSDDFIGVFASLNDYQVQNSGNTICLDCISSLENDWENSNIVSRVSHDEEPLCNCKWTCGGVLGPEVKCTTTTCKETSAGCGFLWLQTCEKRDVIVDAEGECS
jgi:hypothetical protein